MHPPKDKEKIAIQAWVWIVLCSSVYSSAAHLLWNPHFSHDTYKLHFSAHCTSYNAHSRQCHAAIWQSCSHSCFDHALNRPLNCPVSISQAQRSAIEANRDDRIRVNCRSNNCTTSSTPWIFEINWNWRNADNEGWISEGTAVVLRNVKVLPLLCFTEEGFYVP